VAGNGRAGVGVEVTSDISRGGRGVRSEEELGTSFEDGEGGVESGAGGYAPCS
jgi:hypothetical protein